jgi:hypothetical protein
MMSDVSAMIVATGNGADHIPSTTNCVGPEKTRALSNTAFLPSSARLPGQDAEDESHDKASDLEGHATLRSGTRPGEGERYRTVRVSAVHPCSSLIRRRPSLGRLDDLEGRERYEDVGLAPQTNAPRPHQRYFWAPMGTSPRRHSRSLPELANDRGKNSVTSASIISTF